jgi:hypothetical protein
MLELEQILEEHIKLSFSNPLFSMRKCNFSLSKFYSQKSCLLKTNKKEVMKIGRDLVIKMEKKEFHL